VADPGVQKAALLLLCHLLGGPIIRPGCSRHNADRYLLTCTCRGIPIAPSRRMLETLLLDEDSLLLTWSISTVFQIFNPVLCNFLELFFIRFFFFCIRLRLFPLFFQQVGQGPFRGSTIYLQFYPEMRIHIRCRLPSFCQKYIYKLLFLDIVLQS
jgi:hypothetical protein